MKGKLLDLIYGHFKHKAIEIVRNDVTLRATSDNRDKKIIVATRKLQGNKSLHLMATNLIQNRVNSNHLQNDKPNHPDIRGLTRNRFSMSTADWKIYKSSSMVLIERILVHHVPCFKSLNNVLAKHIQHYPANRLEHCSPFKPVMWHTNASLLQYSHGMLYHANSVDQVGTQIFQREA